MMHKIEKIFNKTDMALSNIKLLYKNESKRNLIIKNFLNDVINKNKDELNIKENIITMDIKEFNLYYNKLLNFEISSTFLDGHYFVLFESTEEKNNSFEKEKNILIFADDWMNKDGIVFQKILKESELIEVLLINKNSDNQKLNKIQKNIEKRLKHNFSLNPKCLRLKSKENNIEEIYNTYISSLKKAIEEEKVYIKNEKLEIFDMNHDLYVSVNYSQNEIKNEIKLIDIKIKKDQYKEYFINFSKDKRYIFECISILNPLMKFNVILSLDERKIISNKLEYPFYNIEIKTYLNNKKII